MANPWLNIPLDDYEGHMKSADVQQLEVLAELFAEVLDLRRPASVAVLGVAGGNGLDRVARDVTTRVVGVDLNPLYLDEVRRRFPDHAGLDLHCANLAEERLSVEPVDLVHVALVFEHAGVELCLENALSLVGNGGVLSVVLQLPSESTHGVSPSPFVSLHSLKSLFAFVDPVWLRETLGGRGLELGYETRRSLPGGKAFWMGVFGRAVAAGP